MKKFSKFEIAAIKRTAANVEKLVEKKNKLKIQIDALQTAYEEVCKSIDSWQTPILNVTGGFTTEDLIVKEKNEKGFAKFSLRYPDTVIPILKDTETVETVNTTEDVNTTETVNTTEDIPTTNNEETEN